MRLTIVGCGDAFGSGGRSNTCFMLETAKATLAVDFGASALPALKKQGIDPNRIDGIVLSHLHGDHYFGLIGLINSLSLLSHQQEMHVFGPAPLKEIIELLEKVELVQK